LLGSGLLRHPLGILCQRGLALRVGVVVFSTVNAYTAGMSRVVYAAALDGSLPKFLASVDPKTGVPRRALVALFVLFMLGLTAF
jgi:amino acid transporter